jgi:LytS/YehU family sensor histidine kinase
MASTALCLGAILYGLCVVANYLAIAYERTRELETRALQGELTARDAELRMLRTQVDPHFLFNSLNSISALTAINPAGARDMTVQLAEFFRSTLGFEANSRITLEEELRLLHHFIAIEQVRFGQRLGFAADVTEEAGECLLPPLVLQPLVENAIKHGIGQLVDGGQVRVSARRAGSLLRIAIENDIDDECVPKRGTGLGIANVRQRLSAAYGHEAAVHCTREGQVFRAELVLPATTKEN